MTRRVHPALLHLAGSILFLSLPILFSPESLTLRAYLTNPPTQRDLVIYLLVLGIFYANFFLLIPTYYFTRKYPTFILLNILCFALIIFLPILVIPHSTPQPPPSFYNQPPPSPLSSNHAPSDIHPPDGNFPPARLIRFMDFSQHLFLFLVVLFLALLLKIRDRWMRAEEEKLHTELAYLKTQINPHFLFNILNSIYALALERSDRTAGAIVKLSSMMRYVLLETSRDRVPLEQEISYLTDYIQLQQTRFEDILDLEFTTTGIFEGKTIAPLLLIPFVENAFKHGVNPEQPSAIIIRIDLRGPEFHLQISNNKVDTLPQPPGPAGLGIKNTRQRLGMLYPGQHTLVIEDGATHFFVSLTLQLT